ncbi:TPA: SEL1-like repeat protein [Escherichia coli]|uniref:SEL1-like repeat protein n=1 Tax=Escherichia coli TaxID=562 RepID=UPI000E2021A7|nr:SEL1-like repeat protein [Escherichia coli]EIY9332246.1 SEL1-like repeat protein [Escherichia coli]MCV5814174.1 SEL1-like repeat protein [Escherichia coli]HBB8295922.1 SEL1-like repeat protein [Escherichia coli]
MSINIMKSTLLPDELLTIEESVKIKSRAYPGYIADKEALLRLVIHAWQWDKNAMVQYALILAEAKDQPEDRGAEDEINGFLHNHEDKIINCNGGKLTIPVLLTYSSDFIIKSLADSGHPLASNYMRGKLLPDIDSHSLEFLPLTEKKRQSSIFYTQNAISGGYKLDLLLNDYILFPSGVRYTDVNYSQLVKLTERVGYISENNLRSIIVKFEFNAFQGASYAMIRLCEIYFYGIGVKQSYETAYAWCMLANKSFNKYKDGGRRDWHEDRKEMVLNEYNENFSTIIETLIGVKNKAAIFLFEQLNMKVLNWDYYKWVSVLNKVQPIQ